MFFLKDSILNNLSLGFHYTFISYDGRGIPQESIADYLIDDTEISAGQFHIVPPGEYHKFEALEDTIAFELYWAEFNPNDIVRDKQGGKNGA